MLDIDLIRRDPAGTMAALDRRGSHIDVEPILVADRRRRELIARIEAIRGDRKRLGQEIGRKRGAGEETGELEAEAASARDELGALTPELETVESELRDRMLELPNLPDERVPAGGKEANRVVRTWGEPPDLPNPEDHVEISRRLGLVDHERGTKLGGRGFWLYRGMGAALEWALLDYFVRSHVADGYEFMLPPHLLLDEVGYAAGQFPKFVDDVFHLQTAEGERPRFLLPTAETAILSVFGGEILEADELPRKAFAYTPCYRREAGGYRTEERGTVRGHQFNKVELFQFVAPEGAEAALDGARRQGRAPRAGARPALPDVAAGRRGRERVDGDHLRRRGVDPEHGHLQGGVVGVARPRLPGAAREHPLPGRRQAHGVRPHAQRVGARDEPPRARPARAAPAAGRLRGRPGAAPALARDGPAGPAAGVTTRNLRRGVLSPARRSSQRRPSPSRRKP